MKNKTVYIGMIMLILLFFTVIGLEIYINGRPETFDYCNVGDYPYSNWYYEYGEFDWKIVNWGKIFGTAKIYFELLLFTPWLVCFYLKIWNKTNGFNKSIWFKSLMWMSVIPLIVIFIHLLAHSEKWVVDYDTESDPVARNISYLFVVSMLVYYLNLSLWVIVNFIKKIIAIVQKIHHIGDR